MNDLLFIVVMAFTAQGAYAAMQPGMILAWVGEALGTLPTWLHKPTHTCSVCMVSGWGIPAMLYTSQMAHIPLEPYMVPVYLLAAAGINWATA